MEQITTFIEGMQQTAVDRNFLTAFAAATATVITVHYWGVMRLRLAAWRERRRMNRDRHAMESQQISDCLHDFIERKIESGEWDTRSRRPWYALFGKAGLPDMAVGYRPAYKLMREAQLKAAICKRIDRGIHRPVPLPDAVEYEGSEPTPIVAKTSESFQFWQVFQKKGT